MISEETVKEFYYSPAIDFEATKNKKISSGGENIRNAGLCRKRKSAKVSFQNYCIRDSSDCVLGTRHIFYTIYTKWIIVVHYDVSFLKLIVAYAGFTIVYLLITAHTHCAPVWQKAIETLFYMANHLKYSVGDHRGKKNKARRHN